MNERIKLLAEQAKMFATPMKFHLGGQDYARVRDEKFAELIVQECGLWFNDRLVVEPDYGMEHRIERNRAVVSVMKEFNRHFGVEE